MSRAPSPLLSKRGVALVEWAEVGEGVGSLPVVPVLVRTAAPGATYHVATYVAGNWRLHGAADRVLYGIEAWAEIADG